MKRARHVKIQGEIISRRPSKKFKDLKVGKAWLFGGLTRKYMWLEWNVLGVGGEGIMSEREVGFRVHKVLQEMIISGILRIKMI